MTEEYRGIVSDRNTEGLSLIEECRGILIDRGIQKDCQ